MRLKKAHLQLSTLSNDIIGIGGINVTQDTPQESTPVTLATHKEAT